MRYRHVNALAGWGLRAPVSTRMTWQFALPLFVLSLVLALPAAARPCGQVVPCTPITLEGPIPNPLPGDPVAVADNPVAEKVRVETIPQSYVQEEFFFAGDVDVFDYDQHPGERGAFPGERLVAVQSDVWLGAGRRC